MKDHCKTETVMWFMICITMPEGTNKKLLRVHFGNKVDICSNWTYITQCGTRIIMQMAHSQRNNEIWARKGGEI